MCVYIITSTITGVGDSWGSSTNDRTLFIFVSFFLVFIEKIDKTIIILDNINLN